MIHIIAHDMTDLHRRVLSHFTDSDRTKYEFESAPRGKPIREILGASLELVNPRARLINSPIRNVNYGFAVGELCWYVRGDNDLETMRYYNKRMAQFSDDDKTINSAYGFRMFRALGARGMSQWSMVVEELVRDPDSRRAIVHINEPSDLYKVQIAGSKDVPCTLSLQFFVRDRRLWLHVTMRSNDVIWGMPYDIFSFTCLQEAMMLELQARGVDVSLGLGHYMHTAGSLHIYDTHFKMAGEVAEELANVPPEMKPFTLEQIEYMAHEAEPAIRFGSGFDVAPLERPDAETILWMEQQLQAHRRKRTEEANKEKK